MTLIQIAIFLIVPLFGFCQTSIVDNTLPSNGDTLWTSVDLEPNLRLGRGGPNQYWDFSSLNSGISHKSVLRKTDKLLLLPGFDFDFLQREEKEVIRFFKRIGKKLYEIAVQRPHPLNSDYICFAQYESPKLIKSSEIKYEDDEMNPSIIYYTLPGTEIPTFVKNKLPIKADSIRIKVDEIQDLHMDGWGVLRLSYRNFDVLRQNQYITTTTTAEIYSAGRWSTINSRLLDPNEALLKTIREQHYVFYADHVKEPIAKVKLDALGKSESVAFKASNYVGNLIEMKEGMKEYILSPNPTFGEVKLELVNIDFGNYTFEILDVIGKKLWSKEITISRSLESFKYDFSFLGKGTYLWTITNSNGRPMATKKMVVITP